MNLFDPEMFPSICFFLIQVTMDEYYLRPSDPEFAERVARCLRELSEENNSDPELSDDEDDPEFSVTPVAICRSADQDVYDDSTEEESQPDVNSNYPPRDAKEGEDTSTEPNTDLLERNGFRWEKKEPNQRIRTSSRNIIKGMPGIKGPAKALGHSCEAVELWDLLFTEKTVQRMVN